MKRLRTIILGALFSTALMSVVLPCRATGSDVLVGDLSYAAPPEISICFCGSYLLSSDVGSKAAYLVSESIDFAPFVGLRITVHGRSYTGLCSGTLARICDYFAVEKIAAAVRADSEGSTWGAIKSLYR